MKADLISYDIRINYVPQAFESHCLDAKDQFDAIVKTVQMLKRKWARTGGYKTIKNIEVWVASCSRPRDAR